MKTKWEQFWKEIEKTDVEINSFLETGCLNTVGIRKAQVFVNQWNIAKKQAAEVDKHIMTVDPLQVQLSFKTEPLVEMWIRWKDYINEQHGQIMKSRSEQSALEHLMEIAGKDEARAVKFLRYAMTNRYKNFFAIEDKDTKQPAKGETKGSDFD